MKDKLMQRMVLVEKEIHQAQVNMKQLGANLNMLLGAKEELSHLLKEVDICCDKQEVALAD